MNISFQAILNHWLHEPLFWLTITCLAFLLGKALYQVLGHTSLLPPILTAMIIIMALLSVTGTSYSMYMKGGQYLHTLLGPVIVMLAIPLYQHIGTISKQFIHILFAIMAGSATTVACAAAMVYFWLGDGVVFNSMLSKSVTTPVAVAISQQIGGVASLAAAFVIITGVLAAVMAPFILRIIRRNDTATVGLTLGICGHAVGTARAMEISTQHGAYATTAMSLTGILHAFVLPWLF